MRMHELEWDAMQQAVPGTCYGRCFVLGGRWANRKNRKNDERGTRTAAVVLGSGEKRAFFFL